MKTHFLIEVLEWAEKRPNGFTQAELMASRTFEPWEQEILDGYFANANTNHRRKGMPNFVYLPETIFHVIRVNAEMAFVLTPDALFKHIDHTELKLARQTAKEAKTFSEKSIEVSEHSMRIAMLAVGVSVTMPLLIAWLVTQTVKLEEAQLKDIESRIYTTDPGTSASSTKTP